MKSWLRGFDVTQVDGIAEVAQDERIGANEHRMFHKQLCNQKPHLAVDPHHRSQVAL